MIEPRVARAVAEAPNQAIRALLGEELPAPADGRARDPYMEQGCHPDIVERVWDQLGGTLPRDCRAQAKGRPVLANPDSDRIFALAHGTAYALWLNAPDCAQAFAEGATTRKTWGGGKVSERKEEAGPGRVCWYDDEPAWVRHAHQASGHVDGRS